MVEDKKKLEQYSEHHSNPPERVRVSCRGLAVRDKKVLLSYECTKDIYMSPGGGLEADETYEECCKRELLEETGYNTEPVRHFLTIDEYCFETLYVSHYFICDVVGEGEKALTETEIAHGMEPRWVDINEAINIFSRYPGMREDQSSLYLREYTVLNEFIK
jgi:ADP-ribose pyrophosphatase YjhB (NUDIX family)